MNNFENGNYTMFDPTKAPKTKMAISAPFCDPIEPQKLTFPKNL